MVIRGSRWGVLLSLTVIAAASLTAQRSTKLEAATGSVSGTVTCADTNAPARFAVVTLERLPGEKAASSTPKAKVGETVVMNDTASTDLEGRFVLDKVPAGRYFVVVILPGYLNPLGRFDPDERKKMSEETRKQMLRVVPTVDVEPSQPAQVSLRIERASELNGTVLFDDGSPAIGLGVGLLRRNKQGGIVEADRAVISGKGMFMGKTDTDDHGRYALIGIPPGDYVVYAEMKLQKFRVSGLLDGEIGLAVYGDEGEDLKIYSPNSFREKSAKVTSVGIGEQIGGLDITIAQSGLHTLRGVLTAKRDGHALNRGHIELTYADDGKTIASAEVERDGSFSFPYTPEDKYILKALSGADVEFIARHEFNSNFEDEKVVKKYADTELPVTVMADMSDLVLAAGEPGSSNANKAAVQPQ